MTFIYSVFFNLFFCFVLCLNAGLVNSIDDISNPLDVSAFYLPTVINITQQEELFYYVVEHYAKQGDLDTAISTVTLLPDDLKVISKPLYNTAVLSYYSVHGTSNVVETIRQMESSIQDYMLEKCVLAALASSNETDAEYFYLEMTQPILISRAATSIIQHLAKLFELDKAMSLMPAVQLSAQRDDAFSALINAFATVGNVDAVQGGLNQLNNETKKAALLMQLISTFAEQEAYADAYLLAESIDQTQTYEEAILRIIHAYAKNGQFDAAIQLAQTLTLEINREEAVFLLGVGFAKAGNLDAIYEALDRITIPGLRVRYISEISIELALQGFSEQACNLADSLPSTEKLAIFKLIGKAMGYQNEFHFNLLLIQKLTDTDIMTETLAEFSTHLAFNDHSDKALLVLEKIDNPLRKNQILFQILSTQEPLIDRHVYEDALSDAQFKARYILASIDSQSNSAYASEQIMENKINMTALTVSQKVRAYLMKSKYHASKQRIGKAKKELSLARRLLIMQRFNLPKQILRDFFREYQSLEGPDKFLATLKKMPDKFDRLFYLDLVPAEKNERSQKRQVKRLQSFAKSYKK